MAKSYDAVTKRLIDTRPGDWLQLLGLPATDAEPIQVELIDTDLSTVTSQSDRVLRVTSPAPGLLHIELESGHHGVETPHNLLLYNTLIRKKFKLPVISAVILLCPEADSPHLSGTLQYHNHVGEPYLWFKYQVVRVWELPVENLLKGGIGTLPLAPIANVTPDQLPEVVRRMRDRLDAETEVEENRELWISAKILMGLRYTNAMADQLLKGVREMRESVVYQEILKEGRIEGRAEGRAAEARHLLVLAGNNRLGKPSRQVQAEIDAIESLERLEKMILNLGDVESWSDLLTEF